MAADVKGWEQLFYVCLILSLFYRKSRSQEDTTVAHADIRGLVPTFLASVGCRPHSRDERTCRPHHAAEGATTPGRRLFRERLETLQAVRQSAASLCLRCPGTLLGNGPHEGPQCSGKGDDGLWACWPVAMSWRYRLQRRPGPASGG